MSCVHIDIWPMVSYRNLCDEINMLNKVVYLISKHHRFV